MINWQSGKCSAEALIPAAWLGAALTLATLLDPWAAMAEELRYDPGTLTKLAHVDERFQSYNIEMAEVIGGRFWKPYAHMTMPDHPVGELRVGIDPNLFERRPPVDLGNQRLRTLAAALGPAYVRVSGTWANSVYFQNDDAPALEKPPEGFRGVLTRPQWKAVLGFTKAVDSKLVTSFTISTGVRDTSGVWTPIEAGPLLEFTRLSGGEIFAAEFFNEPNLPAIGAAPEHYGASWFARDSAVFRTFISGAAPGLRIIGPGDASVASLAPPGSVKAEEILTAEPHPRFDIFSYHFYGALSRRCAPPGSVAATSAEQALSESWLARTDESFESHKGLGDRYAPNAPIWITETAEAACGGDPWAGSFLDSFRYLDQMGRLAKRGVSAIFHNTLAASEYGLIDQMTLEPRPNYWAALLWRRLMGNDVLDAGLIREGVHIYAHCLRMEPGGVSLLAINLGVAAQSLKVSQPAEVYALTAHAPEDSVVLLNGRALSVDRDGRIPELIPNRVKTGNVNLDPKSISFIGVPGARNPNCYPPRTLKSA